ncbi:carbohydrate ABC transporter permease [Jiangella asiatica]|uniref:Carbohydrate ABC transporter permease n=1 Tax=Jiangella asiatica TaxID=2530372 RepID=A0A4R5DHU9_9ACTN|nr:carbohydrate ABC transporter permease [Jiangella asiatica]TDE11454.1 carbohydrate ABC transporter permease [Jiangella asiatica]
MSRPRTSSPARPMWMGRPSFLVTVLKAVVLSVTVVVMLYPFLYVIAGSFASSNARSEGSLSLIPTSFSLDAYASVLSGGIVTRALMVSIGVTVIGTLFSVTLTILMAYGLMSTKDVPGGRVILYLVLFTMLFGAGIIPNYLLVRQLGLLDTYASLILPGAISAFNLVVVRNFFMNIPREILDCARIDGASEWRILSMIVVPLSKGVIAVIALFYGVAYWNDFFNAMIYLNDTAKWPVQLVLNQYVLQGSPLTPLQNPAAPPPPADAVQMVVVVLATVPILIVYPFIQRYFTKGVLTGAIKG